MEAHLRAGIAVFNGGGYHTAHDCWEARWLDLESGTDDERFLHGLIQYTAAVHHASERNWGGATGLADGAVRTRPAFDTTDRYPVGTGDAFVGGFLAGTLADESFDRALSMGAATAALKREIPGDVAAVDPTEVESLLDGTPDGISR